MTSHTIADIYNLQTGLISLSSNSPPSTTMQCAFLLLSTSFLLSFCVAFTQAAFTGDVLFVDEYT